MITRAGVAVVSGVTRSAEGAKRVRELLPQSICLACAERVVIGMRLSYRGSMARLISRRLLMQRMLRV